MTESAALPVAILRTRAISKSDCQIAKHGAGAAAPRGQVSRYPGRQCMKQHKQTKDEIRA